MTVAFSVNMSLNSATRTKINNNEPLYHFSVSKVFPQEYIANPVMGLRPLANFQGAMKYTILIGQCFGLNPVMGIFGKEAASLRFSYYSGRCIYSVMSMIGQSFLVISCFAQLMKGGDRALAANSFVVFYFANTLITVSFFRMAIKWPKLCKEIEKIEIVDPNMDSALALKINCTCVGILSMSLVEHILSDLSEASLARICRPDKHPFDAYLHEKFHWLWMFMPYNTIMGLLCKFINIQCNMNWSFSDAFIMCMCIYLIGRLKQVNDRLVAVKGKKVPLTFWRTMREDYTKTTTLVRMFDDTINGVIFVSFASNLFTYCFLLLHLLEKGFNPTLQCEVENADYTLTEGVEHTTYYVFALVFFIIRFLAVSLLAAQVNSASNEPAYALYDVPSAAYCAEVQRFLEQIHGDSVVLTGLQFFSVKRGMVLTIAATIVTYELVLIQFSDVAPANAS